MTCHLIEKNNIVSLSKCQLKVYEVLISICLPIFFLNYLSRSRDRIDTDNIRHNLLKRLLMCEVPYFAKDYLCHRLTEIKILFSFRKRDQFIFIKAELFV